MRRFRARQRLLGWIAASAILMALLVPSLGQVFEFGKVASLVEVCTSQGSKWVDLGTHKPSPSPASAHVLAHCLFCSLHAPVLGLPPSSAVVRLPNSPRHDGLPALFKDASHRTLHAWVTALPRAPPSRSD